MIKDDDIDNNALLKVVNTFDNEIHRVPQDKSRNIIICFSIFNRP